MERRPLLLLTDRRKYGSFSKEALSEKDGRHNLWTLIEVTCSCLTFFLLHQLGSQLLLHQPEDGDPTSSLTTRPSSDLMRGCFAVSAPLAGLVTARRGRRTASLLGALLLSPGILLTSLTWSSVLSGLGICVTTGGGTLLLLTVITRLLDTWRPHYRTGLALILTVSLLLHLLLPPLHLSPWLWPVLPVLALLTNTGDGGQDGGEDQPRDGGGGGGVGVCERITVTVATVVGVMSSQLALSALSSQFSLPPCLLLLVAAGVLTDLALPSRPLLLCRTSLWLATPLTFLLAITDPLLMSWVTMMILLLLLLLLASWSLTAATSSLSSLPLSLGVVTSAWAGLHLLLPPCVLSQELCLVTAGCLLALAGSLYHLSATLRNTGTSGHSREISLVTTL